MELFDFISRYFINLFICSTTGNGEFGVSFEEIGEELELFAFFLEVFEVFALFEFLFAKRLFSAGGGGGGVSGELLLLLLLLLSLLELLLLLLLTLFTLLFISLLLILLILSLLDDNDELKDELLLFLFAIAIVSVDGEPKEDTEAEFEIADAILLALMLLLLLLFAFAAAIAVCLFLKRRSKFLETILDFPEAKETAAGSGEVSFELFLLEGDGEGGKCVFSWRVAAILLSIRSKSDK